jgi:hypothetical protein
MKPNSAGNIATTASLSGWPKKPSTLATGEPHASRSPRNVPAVSIGPGIVFVGGDSLKHEVYDVQLHGDLAGVTALRLEVLPDSRFPSGGLGRVDYEGVFGNFSSRIQPWSAITRLV